MNYEEPLISFNVKPSLNPPKESPSLHMTLSQHQETNYNSNNNNSTTKETSITTTNSRKRKVQKEERKYACDYEGCGKAFKRNCHLKRHKIIHLPKTERQRFYCTFGGCDKHYGTKYDLTAHIKKVHERVPIYKCDVKGCSRRFVKKESLEKHVMDDHPEKYRLIQLQQQQRYLNVNRYI